MPGSATDLPPQPVPLVTREGNPCKGRTVTSQPTPRNVPTVCVQSLRLSRNIAPTAISSSTQTIYRPTVMNGLVHLSIMTCATGARSTSKSTRMFSNARYACIHSRQNVLPTIARVLVAGHVKNRETKPSLSLKLQSSQLQSRRHLARRQSPARL